MHDPSAAATAVPTAADEISNWKDNSTFLYDFLVNYVLEWPSLTISFLPPMATPSTSPHSGQKGVIDSVADPESVVVQRLLLGTHTAEGEMNHILFLDVCLPIAPVPADSRVYSTQEDYAGFDYGPPGPKFAMRRRIPHPVGEPNKVRWMPQSPGIIAAISVGGNVTIYDGRDLIESDAQQEEEYRKPHDRRVSNRSFEVAPAIEDVSVPTLHLKEHESEGWGLQWSPYCEGWLATAADDKKVCIWDIRSPETIPTATYPDTSAASSTLVMSAATPIAPVRVFQRHTAAVQDVCWHPTHDKLVASAADDGTFAIWDVRDGGGLTCRVAASEAPLNALQYSPFRPYLLAVGGSDADVVLWDTRHLAQSVHKLEAHAESVCRIEFAPFSERFIASSGGDRKVVIWDLGAVGNEQSVEDAADGPPELLFTHAGHASSVNDFSWNPDPLYERMITSTSEDNQLQVWTIASTMFLDDDEDDDECDTTEVE